MTHSGNSLFESLPLPIQLEINEICVEFEKAWRGGRTPTIEEYSARITGDARQCLMSELIALEMDLRLESGEEVVVTEYKQRFAENVTALDVAIGLLGQRVESKDDDTDPLLSLSERATADTDPAEPSDEKKDPKQIGRFIIQKRLGQGGFGIVYLAKDPDLNRLVAVKMPRRQFFSSEADVDRFVEEARTAAQLHHPGLVPVYDVSRNADEIFIVQHYVGPQNLRKYRDSTNVPPEKCADLLASVAEALAYAHQRGFVHRDLKPDNILLDDQGRPQVADFGLTIHESIQRRRRGEQSGTPAYMSPEQVRGETHRMDGRSDIWSLGVILYELLTGSRPFGGSTLQELYDEIQYREPRPLRQRDATIPAELDRICSKCLEKRMTDRYSSAVDLAQDLRHWLESSVGKGTRDAAAPEGQAQENAPQPVRIVPKGLRSFDERDADGFLELLPGPRDRDGLPPTIRFWKTRIEETDADVTFPVGVMYGPSGCGKSSLVKAGLLPRLADHIASVYVEATPDETETRLLTKLKKCVPSVADDQPLPAILGVVREVGLGGGRKLLLVLDQFEQWLHAHGNDPSSQLLHALRQCDGGHVQCLVLVREEYAVACLRFLDQLDMEMREGENFGLVDLFDQRHAEKVLRLFGKAFGALPDADGDLSTAQQEFITESTRQLADDKDRVICVRLALFAEMIKGKPWVPASLTQLGGAYGVGVAFLEESLSTESAKPTHRVHQKAARAVLKALLPESGTEGIKGSMRSYEQLLNITDYAKRPADFDEVIRILDSELRLITPTDPAAATEEDDGIATDSLGKHFQLTHDYLVPSLRDWLTRKQKETRRGRAELRLAERSALWNAKPENRYLPKWWEHSNIRLFTRKKDWTAAQRNMMRTSGRFHLMRTAILLLILGLIGWGAYETNGRYRAASLVKALDTAKEDAVLNMVNELRAYWRWARPLLIDRLGAAPQTIEEERRQLHARIAMVAEDESQVPTLLETLLTGDVSYNGVICDALRDYKGKTVSQLWDNLQDKSMSTDQRFRAGLALAQFVPDDERWTASETAFMAAQLVGTNPEEQPRLREYLHDFGRHLLPDLEQIFQDESANERQQIGAANALADFASNDLGRLARIASVATPGQYAILYPLIGPSRHSELRDDLQAQVRQQPDESLPQKARIALGRRRAGAAITMLRNGDREQMFDVLRVTDDPESLTQFVHRCRDRRVTATELLDCLDRADVLRQAKTGDERKMEDRVLFGLLSALGDFPFEDTPQAQRGPLSQKLAHWYATDPSSALHGATGWLLRRWGFAEAAEKVDHTPLPYDATGQREWFVLEVNAEKKEGILSLLSASEKVYFTFIVFPPGEFIMGSPEDEADRENNEACHLVKIPRPIAVCDRELTWEQWTAFEGTGRLRGYSQQAGKELTTNDPAFGVTWFEAVEYCRWLTTQAGMASTDQCYGDPEPLPKDAEGNPREWPVHLDRHGFRLPTEAEWEYVCRSGANTAYCFGSDPQLLGHYGWFVDNSEKWSHLVGQKRPNLLGLFDLHGNMSEWCHDWYDDYDPGDVQDAGGVSEGSDRVDRGGSWYYAAANCRTAVRYGYQPTYRANNLGFRVAAVLSGEQVSE